MMLDIDHFKQINDTYGHLVGDEVIKSVAAECQRHLRTTDILARYGGEEFICLLGEGRPEDAQQIAKRIRQMIAESRLAIDQQVIPITVSAGIAALDEQDIMLGELINQADQALYESKSNGRNRVSVWGALRVGQS
jgi:two-component system, cell cycle response regulator